MPDGCGGGREDPDEKAALNSGLVGAGDHQVVSRLQLFMEDHLSLIGVAGSGSAWGFV